LTSGCFCCLWDALSSGPLQPKHPAALIVLCWRRRGTSGGGSASHCFTSVGQVTICTLFTVSLRLPRHGVDHPGRLVLSGTLLKAEVKDCFDHFRAEMVHDRSKSLGSPRKCGVLHENSLSFIKLIASCGSKEGQFYSFSHQHDCFQLRSHKKGLKGFLPLR